MTNCQGKEMGCPAYSRGLCSGAPDETALAEMETETGVPRTAMAVGETPMGRTVAVPAYCAIFGNYVVDEYHLGGLVFLDPGHVPLGAVNGGTLLKVMEETGLAVDPADSESQALLKSDLRALANVRRWLKDVWMSRRGLASLANGQVEGGAGFCFCGVGASVRWAGTSHLRGGKISGPRGIPRGANGHRGGA